MILVAIHLYLTVHCSRTSHSFRSQCGMRKTRASVSLAQMDAADRGLLPKKLMDHAGIGNEVTMVAVNDRVEIWSTEAYQAHMAENPDEMLSFAETLFGDAE